MSFPIASPDLSRGGAFPCQGHGCGCRSAEQCWFGCCCLTASQRLVWAKEHGVTPPEGVTLLAEVEAEAKEAAESDVCCERAAKPSCCSPGLQTTCSKEKASCCGGHADPVKVAKREAKSKRADRPAISCPQCRGGLGHWWVASGQPLALPERPLRLSPPTGSEPVVLSGVSYVCMVASPASRPG